jgi:transcriptional regulator with XRE-family HTH domain
MDEKNVLGRRIKSLLQEQGKSSKDLAAYVGMTRQNLSMVVIGQCGLRAHFGRKVAEYLGITMEQLYDPELDLIIHLRMKPGEKREEVEARLKKELEAYFTACEAQKKQES